MKKNFINPEICIERDLQDVIMASVFNQYTTEFDINDGAFGSDWDDFENNG